MGPFNGLLLTSSAYFKMLIIYAGISFILGQTHGRTYNNLIVMESGSSEHYVQDIKKVSILMSAVASAVVWAQIL